MRLLLLILLFNILPSQYYVINSLNDTSVIKSIETQLIKDVFKLLEKKSKQKVILKIKYHHSFTDLLSYMKTIPQDRIDFELCLNSITITELRKLDYDFSIPYIPIKDVIIHKKGNSKNSLKDSKIGFVNGTIHEIAINHLKKYNSFKAIPLKSIAKSELAILNNKIDFYIGDNINVWNNTDLEIYKELLKQSGSGCGILFAKGSKLREKLNPLLQYYIKSAKFKHLIKKTYGKDISNYFIKSLLVMKD